MGAEATPFDVLTGHETILLSHTGCSSMRQNGTGWHAAETSISSRDKATVG